jgi:hypothetical protein
MAPPVWQADSQKNARDFGRDFFLQFCPQPGRTVGTWKTPFAGAKEHRLEAYATFVFRTVERSLRAILQAVTVHPQLRRNGAM